MLLKEYAKLYTSYVNSIYNLSEEDTKALEDLLDRVLPNEILSIYERATILERFILCLGATDDFNLNKVIEICNKCFICQYSKSRRLFNIFFERGIYKDIEKYVLDKLSVFISDLGYSPEKFLRFYPSDVVCNFLETYSLIFFVRDMCFFNPFFASKIKLYKI